MPLAAVKRSDAPSHLVHNATGFGVQVTLTMLPLHGSARAMPALGASIVQLGLLALALAAVPARPHAIVVVARPAMNSIVGPGELEIRLDFNARIDPQRSRLVLQQPDGTQAPIILVSPGAPNALAGRAQATIAGRWTLSWQELSLDGHITRGEETFSVSDKPAAF